MRKNFLRRGILSVSISSAVEPIHFSREEEKEKEEEEEKKEEKEEGKKKGKRKEKD